MVFEHSIISHVYKVEITHLFSHLGQGSFFLILEKGRTRAEDLHVASSSLVPSIFLEWKKNGQRRKARIREKGEYTRQKEKIYQRRKRETQSRMQPAFLKGVMVIKANNNG